MKKTLIVLGVIIIIVIAGWLLKNNRPGEEIVLERPWIEVVSSLTSEVDSSGQNIKNLQTGDELSDGVILKTDETGEAIIHFPDGSEARLEANSTIIIERAAYNEESGSLFVRLTLSAGRIWSKVISLSTPESEWKVETANAVATVRGTAFGTEFINGDSNFIGSENTVLVKVKNTETGEEIDETETPLTENDVIELKDKDIKKIIALKTALAKKNLDDKTGENLKNWIEKQKEKDNGIKERLETLEKKGLTPEEAKEKLREEIKDKFKKKIIERREEIRKQILEEAEQKTEQNEPVINNILIERLRAKIVENLLARGQKEAALKIKTLTNEEISSLLKLVFSGNLEETLSDETKLKAVLEDLVAKYGERKDTLPLEKTITPDDTNTITSQKITSIKVTSDTNFTSSIVEGREIKLKAIATLANGSTLDISAKCKWQVIGPVGAITSPGVFMPKLGADVSELGGSFGSITAVFESEGGGIYLGKTPIFKVVPQTPETVDELG